MLGCQVYATTPRLCFQTSYIWLNPPRYIVCHNFECNIVLSDTNFTKNIFYSLMCYLISGNVEVRKINGNFSQSSQNVNIHGTGVFVEGICSFIHALEKSCCRQILKKCGVQMKLCLCGVLLDLHCVLLKTKKVSSMVSY